MKMIYKLSMLLAVAILWTQCTPKTAEVMGSQDDMAKEVIENSESFRSKVPSAGPAPTIKIGKANTFKLDNGLQVIVVENHKIPSVSFQLSLKNDQIREFDKVGYISMAGDLLGRGTTTKTKADIDEAIDFIGGSLNTYGSGMFASSLTKHMPTLLEVMTDVLYNPSMPDEELQKIKKQTLTGLAANETDPNAISSNVRAKVMYGGDHPYGEIQKAENVEAITIEDCRDYVAKYFIPNNAYLVIVGDISVSQAEDVAQKYFGKWQKRPYKPYRVKKVEKPTSRNVVFANKDGAVQSVVNVSYPLDLLPGTPDVIPARVMNTILGGGATGRLFLNIREDKGYTYGAYSSLSSDRLVGSFNASASVRNEVTDSTVIEFIKELERIRDEPVDAELLENTKSFMTGSFARSLESPQTIARFALNIFRNELPEDYYETYLQKLNAVTVADVQAMAQKYIKPDEAFIFVVGSKDDVAESLVQFDADGKVDFYDAFGDPIIADKTVIPGDLTGTQVIEDYVNAIGGKTKIASVKSLVSKMSADVMGQSIVIETKVADGKLAMITGNGQMVFSTQVFNGEKAQISAMGNKQTFTEGPEFEAMKSQASICPQLAYLMNGTSIELKGSETVNGVSAYKIMVTKAGGEKVTEYYSIDDGLLIRSVGTQKSPQGEVTVTSDMEDYKDFGGIMFPTTTTISGMMPVALKMKVDDITLNSELDPETFTIKE